MSDKMYGTKERPHRLQRGDEIIFTPRSVSSLKIGVTWERRGKPLRWETAGGWFPGYGLDGRFCECVCEQHALAIAAKHQLRTGVFSMDKEGRFHVRVF